MVSILTPVYNIKKSLLEKCHLSVINQDIQDWEWCIVDDGSTKKETTDYLEYIDSTEDCRIKIKKLEKNCGVSVATQEAFNISSGEYILFLDNDDELYSNTLSEMEHAAYENDSDFVYADEILIDEMGNVTSAMFKPDYGPDSLLSYNYICHPVLVSRDLFVRCGGIHAGFDGSQDHDFLLRASEYSKKIFHIQTPLYKWRNIPTSLSHSDSADMAYENGKRAVICAINRRGWRGNVFTGNIKGRYYPKYYVSSSPKVSIIITWYGDVDLLQKCISSLSCDYKNIEIIVIADKDIVLPKIEHEYLITYENNDYVSLPAKINNAIKKSNGEYILLLHDDVTITNSDYINILLGHCQRSDVGVVGGKFLKNDSTIDNCGIIIGINGLYGKAFSGNFFSKVGYVTRDRIIHNLTAVSDCCMMFKKSLFDDIGGFSSEYLRHHYCVDFCIRAQELGYYNVFNPNLISYHMRLNRTFKNEENTKYNDDVVFKNRNKNIIENGDPNYNRNLSQTSENFEFKLPTDNKIFKEHIQTKLKYSIIMPLYESSVPYPIAIPSLLLQRYGNFEIIAVHDGEISENYLNLLKSFNDDRLKIFYTEKRYNDWGHTPREYGITKISPDSDLVIITGADNYYVPSFLDKMLECFNDKSTYAAYCDCLHNYLDWTIMSSRLEFGYIDCGVFVSRSSIAKEIGWKHKVHAADWKFIEELIEKYGREKIVKLSRILFVHN